MYCPKKERDSRREKLYRAEYEALHHLKDQLKFSTVEEMQKYTDELTDTKWFRKRFGILKIKVKDGRGRKSACAWFNTISMPVWSLPQ